MVLVPDVAFNWAPGETHRTQVGPETLYVAKWVPCYIGRLWRVSSSHRVVGLVGVVRSRVAGLDRQMVGARQ